MEHKNITSHKDLIVWQKAMDLVVEIYALTEKFPRSELYGITSQMRRAAVSIPSNIAEGRRRRSKREFRHFLLNAFGSGAELETQIGISERLPFGKELSMITSKNLLEETMKMLNALISKLEQSLN